MCKDQATSREHAPPKCLFPRANELGVDFRRNLITVPSCDRHNSEKSKDDEYFRAVLLSATAHRSDIASNQFLGKLLRAVRRAPGVYGEYLTEEHDIPDANLRAVRMDRLRFNRCIEHLAKAIFFDQTGAKWLLPISVASPDLFSLDENRQAAPHAPSAAAVSAAREYLAAEPIRGENPEVFKYRLRHEPEIPCFGFAAQFYGAFEIFGFSSKELFAGAA